MFQLLGLPIPCESQEDVGFEFWGSASSNGQYVVVGVNPTNLQAASGQRCTMPGLACLIASGEKALELGRANDGWVSDSGIVALADDRGLSFWERSGQQLGEAPGRFADFRCEVPRGVTGFLPESDLLIRAGSEALDGRLRHGVRCIRVDGSTVWEHETPSTPTAVVLDGAGDLTVYCGARGIRVSSAGEFRGEFEGSLGRPYGETRHLLRSN